MHGYCDKHGKEMTGFHDLYCADCVREQDSQFKFDKAVLNAAQSQTALGDFRHGELVTLRGVLAWAEVEEEMVVGELAYHLILVPFQSKEAKLIERLPDLEGAYILLTGNVQELFKRPKYIEATWYRASRF